MQTISISSQFVSKLFFLNFSNFNFFPISTFESLSDAKYVIRKNVKIRLFGKELSVEFAQGERKSNSIFNLNKRFVFN